MTTEEQLQFALNYFKKYDKIRTEWSLFNPRCLEGYIFKTNDCAPIHEMRCQFGPPKT